MTALVPPAVDSSRWFSGGPRVESASLRLFCFAHAGGGGSSYWALRRALAPHIDVCPVVLPGRESRIRETPETRIENVLDPLCAAITERASAGTATPFALFGHSLGSLFAYEVARRLTRDGLPPFAVVVSGRRGPWELGRGRHYSGLSDDQFVAAVSRLGGMPPEILAQQQLMQMVLPVLRADFQINENYHPQPGSALTCPLTAYSGSHDPEVTRAELLSWERETSGEFAMRVFAGGHFYLRNGRPDVVSALRADLPRLAGVN